MFQQIIIISLLTLSLCQYKKLPEHGSVTVEPKTKVYFDISSYHIGDSISFEINMDLFFGEPSCKEKYEFYIEQVPTKSYSDPYYWSFENLRKVTNKNVSCSGEDCTFTWEEIVEKGNYFIYIYPPTPFDGFYTMWGNKIKITHLGGGLGAGAIVGIVFGCLILLVILIILISCCCGCCRQGSACYTCCYNCCPSCICCCSCCGRGAVVGVPPYGGVVQVQPAVVPQVVPVTNYGVGVPPPVYPPPAYPPTVTVYPDPVYQPGYV